MDSPATPSTSARAPLMKGPSMISKVHIPLAEEGNKSELELSIEKMKLGDILGWSPDEACQFLDLVKMPEYKGVFLEHRVSGKVLVQLHEKHLREIGVTSIGHRLVLEEALAILRRKRREYDRNAIVWEGKTPSSCMYTENSFQCCCYPCYFKTYWSFSSKGFTTKPDRGSCWTCLTCNCMRPRKVNYTDYRVLKDIELHTQNTCCCCCTRTALRLVAADQYNHDGKQKGAIGDEEMELMHPDAPHVEEIVRNAWQKVRLVDAGIED
uniref:SAM domain-containing protein n=1 Tax=Palpitomonas bilix TaxID=652834 RepID=A0A7S3CWX8_9EUKA